MKLYETHKMDSPELPFIFINTFRCSTNHRCCISNWHENIEIAIITEGEGLVRMDEDIVPVQADDVIVFGSNQLHDIYSETKMRYACLIIDRSFFLQNYVDSNRIFFDPFPKDPALLALLKKFERDFTADPGTPFRTQSIRCTAMQIILSLCRDHGTPDTEEKSEKKMHSTIKKVIAKIRAESHTEISLDKIAKAEGWSKSYLAREFHRYTGLSMITYLNMVRCENAKKMLSTSDLSIGEIGRQCGFNDQTYFTRTFRAHIGKTPGEYRKKKIAERSREKR